MKTDIALLDEASEASTNFINGSAKSLWSWWQHKVVMRLAPKAYLKASYEMGYYHALRKCRDQKPTEAGETK